MDLFSFFQNNQTLVLAQKLQKDRKVTLSGVGNITSKALLYSQLFHHIQKSICIILPDRKMISEMEYIFSLWSDVPVFSLPHEASWEDFQQNFVAFFSHLQKTPGIFLMEEENLSKTFPSGEDIKRGGMKLIVGGVFNNVEFFNKLIGMGYSMSHDLFLEPGQYRRSGAVIDIFPINQKNPLKIELEYEKILTIFEYQQEEKKPIQEFNSFDLFPKTVPTGKYSFFSIIPEDTLVLFDELDDVEELPQIPHPIIHVTSFPQDEKDYFHLRYLSVLKFYTLFDFLNDLRQKLKNDWKIILLTKRFDEIKSILDEEHLPYTLDLQEEEGIKLVDAHGKGVKELPPSFQNIDLKIELLTDKEIFSLKKANRNKTIKQINLDFLSSLKEGDYVVHFDHGIGRFLGVCQKQVDHLVREYLEIAYADNDKLFIPVDQADKISKYISREDGEEVEPKLSRLGSKDWKNLTRKVKKETELIAKELLELYAKREQAGRSSYGRDSEEQKRFEKAFPYEETPGQVKAIQDIKEDMEKDKPMDRLLCGDVGFGKTEVAMRAAFKAVQDGRQVAFLSPITILADQHYHTFKKRAESFDLNIEMLSRFRTPAEQEKILEDLRKGKIHVIIGTHRLLQPDVQFFNLGLVIIDEEQRFGVKQKEQLKKLRSSVDILTLTATPIPRTLNMSLNKLRDITIITTPPPGRLPVITEVRKFGNLLIRDVILRELEREGQTYFLHNRVETIDSMAEKLRILVPEARFVVAHGQLGAGDLEERILDFKDKKYDVLVSSTIIENGIDLPNANTLIVNQAEQLGLSQLYQLRGRIGRGKIQAHAYFLYHSQKLKDDAKKRLRAVVEASELGAGFQIAMRDLEIRGAGEILGSSQHGTMSAVGVSHFFRLLNQAIEEMRSGTKQEKLEAHEDVTIELPVEAYIPDSYIHDKKEKISVYQRMSAIDNEKLLAEFKSDLEEEFGELPTEVDTLFNVIDIKLLARKAGIIGIKVENVMNNGKQIVLSLSDKVTAQDIIKVLQHNERWIISGTKLKINISDLGFHWMEGLKGCIKKLFEGK